MRSVCIRAKALDQRGREEVAIHRRVRGDIGGRRNRHGQSYPLRPLTMIVPFPPGGPTDAVGRIMAEHIGCR